MEILIQYPNWFIIFCILTAVIFTSALYLRDKLTNDFHPLVKLLLALFRFIAVGVLAFFLLEPLVKNTFIETEKPIVVIAQDNSESIKIKGDSTFYNQTFPSALASLTSSLEESFEVVTFTFGAEVKDGLNLDYSEKQTDYSLLLDEIYARYSNRNLGALIIGSDGIYTKGKNPLYSNTKLKAPIYTIALGDTTKFTDLLIKEVTHNRLAYLGNKFPLEIAVAANSLKGALTKLSVTKNGSILFTKNLAITGDDFLEIVPVILEAKSPGIQKYTISLTPINGEVTVSNNRQDIYIDILDSRQKVAIISATPHPDIKALKRSISSNENYEVDVFLEAEFQKNVSDYNLVIFHQLPSKLGSTKLIDEAMDKKIPSLFIWGTQTNFDSFNGLNLGVGLSSDNGNTNAVSGSVNSGFKAFLIDKELNSVVRKWPPINVPFGRIDASPGIKNLLFQQVGPITTEDPLFTLNEKNDVKVGVFTGEGLWRWRLFNHLDKGNHELFDQWFLKSVQFLASKEDKSLFRVSTKNRFDETQRIIFTAEVYNESFEPLLDQEISVTLKNESGQDYPFTFSQGSNTYRLDAGILPAGNYTYTSSVNAGGKKLTKSGEFSISPVIAEQLRTQADHNLLFNLAERNGGKMITPSELDSLSDTIKSNSEIVAVSYEKKSLSDLINYKWLLFLILGLLCLEWLTRKRSGAY